MISSVDPAPKQQILELLAGLDSFRGDSKMTRAFSEHGIRETKWRPKVSTFSDNVVISAPMTMLREMTTAQDGTAEATGGLSVFVLAVTDLASQLLARASKFGCLVRGGLAVGPLYHCGGVVFGEALVKAYELESSFARYPRVIVSRQAKYGLSSYIVSEDDGFQRLDLFARLNDRQPPGWREEITDLIDRQIHCLEKRGKHRGLQNWMWLRSDFLRTFPDLDATS